MLNNPLLASGANDLSPIGSTITAASNRKITPTKHGAILKFSDTYIGNMTVLVLWAKYRFHTQFCTTGSCGNFTGAPTSYSRPSGLNAWSYLNMNNSSTASSTTIASTIPDWWLNTFDGIPYDKQSGKKNCDAWLKTSGKYPAIDQCRSLIINGSGCDVPDMRTLTRIYCDAEAIDSIDPTVVDYPGNALGTKNTNGYWWVAKASNRHVLSSTRASSTMWSLQYTGDVENSCSSSADHSVVPVLEL